MSLHGIDLSAKKKLPEVQAVPRGIKTRVGRLNSFLTSIARHKTEINHGPTFLIPSAACKNVNPHRSFLTSSEDELVWRAGRQPHSLKTLNPDRAKRK